MIELIGIKKTFYRRCVIDNLNLHIPNATIFGLIGSAGSGKSTILRVMSGVYHVDGGYVKIDGQSVYENNLLKQQVMLVSEDPYFLQQSTVAEMRRFYQLHYPDFDDKTYRQLLDIFPLNEKKRLNRFSRGERKQAALVLALATNPKYLLLDEVFSGLDPSLRNALKNILKNNLETFGQTTVITANTLKELDNLCDSMGLLKDGKIIVSGSQALLGLQVCKLQTAFAKDKIPQDFPKLKLLHWQKNGHLIQIIAAGKAAVVTKEISKQQPLFIDVLAMDLEEAFLYEMEAKGYEQN